MNTDKPSLLTNFRVEERPIYEEAIRRFGDNSLVILQEAFTTNGRPLQGCNSLHCFDHKELGPFWEIFQQVKKETSA
jgi:hypothetical protein